MSELSEIIETVIEHQREYPRHGTMCACMDKYIGQIRKLTEVGKQYQSRIDYVIGAAIGHRCVRAEVDDVQE